MFDPATFLTELYVIIDDWDKTQPPEAPRRGPLPRLSRSEVLTIALVGHWGCFSSERDFYQWAERHLPPLAPTHRSWVLEQSPIRPAPSCRIFLAAPGSDQAQQQHASAATRGLKGEHDTRSGRAGRTAGEDEAVRANPSEDSTSRNSLP